MSNPLNRLLRVSEGMTLKRLQNWAEAIDALEPNYLKLSDEELLGQTALFKERLANGEELDNLLFEAFATAREAARRALGERAFPVQLMGAIALHEGNIAEMKTGEGKTLVATMPLYLNALSGRGTHLITANEYLASRDCNWMGQVYTRLGMTAASIFDEMPTEERRAAYQADITYGTNSEFGFDYLRDNMCPSLEDQVQRGHYYAIVDEVDSILIDEARTPLIISGSPQVASETYYAFARIARDLTGVQMKQTRGWSPPEGTDYEFDEKHKTVSPYEGAIVAVERELKISNLYDPRNNQLVNHLIQAMRAKSLYQRDIDYVIQDGEVKIVDPFTGRVMEGRRWSEGLHQAIEAKEGVKIQEEHVTQATVTIQNYFRLYEKLSGMTGTAKTEEKEFAEIYDLDVIPVPTNAPVAREDNNDYIFSSKSGKFQAVVRDIKERHKLGQPVLVGTIAVETSEYLSKLLLRHGVPHNVLNAKEHAREAEIVSQAGKRGAVTIATNMAGRGVDIKIDDEVRALGGLYVLGTERHEARRIDNQLRGRSGRQGDPGESRFYVSAEDDLARIFAGARIQRIMERFNVPEDKPLEASVLSHQIENAQKKVEEMNFSTRKDVLKYDDVLNAQRFVIYSQRQRVLEGESAKEQVEASAAELISTIVDIHTESDFSEEWDLAGLCREVVGLYPTKISPSDLAELEREDIREKFIEDAAELLEEKEKTLGSETMRNLERFILLTTVDARWRDHLDSMEYMRMGIYLRSAAQKDPLTEYRQEGYKQFEALGDAIREETARLLLVVQAKAEDSLAAEDVSPPPSVSRVDKKYPRNARPCPVCGKDRKYKNCCGKV